MDRRSELTRARRAPHPTRLSLESAFGSNRTDPTDADFDIGAVHLGVHNRIGLWWDAQPNESRLSCGALKKDSFHNLRAPSASSACSADGLIRFRNICNINGRCTTTITHHSGIFMSSKPLTLHGRGA